MEDFLDAKIVAAVVNEHGSEAVLEDGALRIYPKDGCPSGPTVFQVPATGFGRRVVIEIGKRCNIPSHRFWHASMPKAGE